MASQVTAVLTLDPDVQDRIQRLASSRQRSVRELVDEAIEQYLEQAEARERLRRGCLKAWQTYQATGEHATSEEVDAWLAKLEAGGDAEPPACHG